MHGKNQEIKECVDLRACAYTNWCKKFRKITFDSVCIPIPEAIVKYLLDEIIILPKECYNDDEDDENVFEQDTGTDAKNDDEDEDEDDVVQPEFPEFSEALTNLVTQLGGTVFVKTNWNSPKDAFWIMAGQMMCCKDITDIYQLLKASGICKEDLSFHNLPVFELEPLADACSSTDTDGSDSSIDQSKENHQFLVFKKWHDIHPGTEFRCFVRNKKLIGVSPRDWPQYHEYICTQRINIVNDIVSIFEEHIKPKFPLYDYVFDVVRDMKDRVFLLDFSPFNEKYTESLAFEWSELLDDCEINPLNIDDDGEEDPEFRYLSSDCGIQPNKRNNYGIPKDVIDMFRASSNSSTEQPTESPNTLDDVISNRLENIFRNQHDEEQNT